MLQVMFCDLVDSTGIAARLDAEEWRDLVGAYLDAASTAVTEMGGKVAKKLGVGLMAAHELQVGGSSRRRESEAMGYVTILTNRFDRALLASAGLGSRPGWPPSRRRFGLLGGLVAFGDPAIMDSSWNK
jgi:class 3 adenylate cyclase